jgi:hypothetical protein
MLPSDKHCEKTSKMMIENVQLYNFSLFHKELNMFEKQYANLIQQLGSDSNYRKNFNY